MLKYIFILSITFLTILSFYTTDEPLIEDDFNTIEPYIQEEPASIEVEIFEDIYIARDLDGFIAIFVPSETVPVMLTDINVKTLPLYDQESLKIGITIDENYGLAKFIEDYSS